MSDPDYFWSVFLMYELFFFDGTGKLVRNDTSDFPDIKPTSFEDFIKQNPDQRFKTSILTTITQDIQAGFKRLEDAVHYLTLNAKNITLDMKEKLSHLISKSEAKVEETKEEITETK